MIQMNVREQDSVKIADRDPVFTQPLAQRR